jgi:SAM-dependent methyltransferase
MEQATRYNSWLIERCLPHLGRRILDVGAGSGTFEEQLAAVADEVVALETDDEQVSQLRRRVADLPNVTVVHGAAGEVDAASLGAPFDSIVCFNVIEHVDDDVGALRSFRGYLRSGGKLLLLAPAHAALFGPLDCTVGHRRRYKKTSLRAALNHAGFDVEQLRLVNPIGAFGWLIAGRVGRRASIPRTSLRAYDRFVPVLRFLDRFNLPVGLSVWAVAAARAAERRMPTYRTTSAVSAVTKRTDAAARSARSSACSRDEPVASTAPARSEPRRSGG